MRAPRSEDSDRWPRRAASTTDRGHRQFAASVGPALAHHSLVERVKDGPAAASTRESYRYLELGESSDNDTTKLQWYNRGKELADIMPPDEKRKKAVAAVAPVPAPAAAPAAEGPEGGEEPAPVPQA